MRFLRKIEVLDNNFDFWEKFWSLTKIGFFDKQLRSLTKIGIIQDTSKFRISTNNFNFLQHVFYNLNANFNCDFHQKNADYWSKFYGQISTKKKYRKVDVFCDFLKFEIDKNQGV